MVLRLSELLERIRPVGTPGAAADTGLRRDLGAGVETAEVARLLAEYESEADAVIADAHERADATLIAAQQTARRLRVELADRVAAAQAEAGSVDTGSDDALAHVGAETEAAILSLHAEADIDRVVARVVQTIWAPVTPREART